MKPIAQILIVLILGMMSSCHEYTLSIAKDNEISPDLIFARVKPDKSYLVKLKSGLEYKIKILTIDKDSLSGIFYLRKATRGAQYKTKDTISLRGIRDVKESKINVAETVAVIVIPIGLTVGPAMLIIDSITFDFGGGIGT